MTRPWCWKSALAREVALGGLLLLASGAARAQAPGQNPAGRRDSLDKVERRAKRARPSVRGR